MTVASQDNSILNSTNDSGLFTNVMNQIEKTCNSEKVLLLRCAYLFSSTNIHLRHLFVPTIVQVETSLQQAINSIQLKLQQFKKIERLVKKRDGLKVDYESFKRKLDAVNEKIASGALSQVHTAIFTTSSSINISVFYFLQTGPELSHRQEKLSRCIEELRATTVEVYAIFAR